MEPLHFIFALHSHQPVGNFDFVFEEAYQKAYLPFLEVLKDFPDIHITLHMTGPIWDWLDENHPEYYSLVRRLVENGQIELMGGAFYEPLICAIPEEDTLNQILYMQRFFQERFGIKPRGMWIAERVWEPYFPKILAQAGIEYTALDDTHFLSAGLDPDNLFGYYLTEHEGYVVKVFPILEKLRYTIPFRPITETIEFLRGKSELFSDGCAVFHDDGEKFGIWPGTYHSVYEEKWLYNFFTSVVEEKEWLKSVTYTEYLDAYPPLGRVYLPCASYHEMMEWVLPTYSQREYLKLKKEFQSDEELWKKVSRYFRGGFWRGFLSKYEESNNMQKRMLKTSRRLNKLLPQNTDNPILKKAQKELFQGQCNCAYWHGVFGGLYLNHLRTAIYTHLIECDKLIDEYLELPENSSSFTEMDFNCDGKIELIYETPKASFFFSPNNGGTLFELDYKPKSFNCLNILSRREEAYHEDLFRKDLSLDIEEQGHKSIHELVKAKEKGLEKYLIYDPYIRSSMRDHFLPLNIAVQDLWRNTFIDWWSLRNGTYTYNYERDKITFRGDGSVHIGELIWEVVVNKTIHFLPAKNENDVSFEIQYCIQNTSMGEFEGYFGSEWCFNLLTGSAEDRYLYSKTRAISIHKLGEIGDELDLKHLSLRDEWQRLEIEFLFLSEARVFNFPIETVSQSENGQERVYQGNVVIPCWKRIFYPNTPVEIIMKVTIKSI